MAAGCSWAIIRRTVSSQEGRLTTQYLLAAILTVAIAVPATAQDPRRIRQEGTPADAMRQQCREQFKAVGMRSGRKVARFDLVASLRNGTQQEDGQR